MTTVSRRVLLYWLLLLIPTLIVGAGALWLVRREEARMDERQYLADTSRRAAIEARTRLIAENIEIIVNDVQSGLMATLTTAPNKNPAAFLAEWQNANPLVRDTFQASRSGQLLWGLASESTLAWLASAPWREADEQSLASDKQTPEEMVVYPIPNDTRQILHDIQQDAQVARNVTQLNQARQELQQISKVQKRADYNSSSLIARKGAPTSKFKKNEVAAVPEPHARRVSYSTPLSADDEAAEPTVPAIHADKKESVRFETVKPEPERTGWTAWRDASGAPHLHGWRLCTNGSVLAVEIDLNAIATRLRDVLPSGIEADEAYAIGEMGNTPAYSVGFADNAADNKREQPIITLPIASNLLPGWAVFGYAAPVLSSNGGRTFFLLATLLVAAVVIAILAGGALLMRQARLSAAESAQKTSFVANVSHELKTPLTTIRLYAELLEQGRIRDEAKRNESLQTISRETQRLARLVNNILDFSRLEQGRRKLNFAEHDLREEVASIVDRYAPRLTEAGLDLTLVPTEGSCRVKTDLDAVEQIVINLLDNACKYAADGGEITVKLEKPEPGKFCITISDRGLGIPAAHREKIFDKFHRLDDSLTAAQGGAGLGLSIARQLARALGGDLVHAPREGRGSSFILTLYS